MPLDTNLALPSAHKCNFLPATRITALRIFFNGTYGILSVIIRQCGASSYFFAFSSALFVFLFGAVFGISGTWLGTKAGRKPTSYGPSFSSHWKVLLLSQAPMHHPPTTNHSVVSQQRKLESTRKAAPRHLIVVPVRVPLPFADGRREKKDLC